MSNAYVLAVALFDRLRGDAGGVVSFEYVVVAGAVVAAVVAAFGTYGGSTGTLANTLTNGLQKGCSRTSRRADVNTVR